jgi:hypothetical protein
MLNNVYIPQESFMLYTCLCFLQSLQQYSASIITCTVQGHMSHLRQRSSTQFWWKQQLRTSAMPSPSTFYALHLPGHQWSKDMTIAWIIEYYLMFSHPLFKTVLILLEWGQVLSCSEISAFDIIPCQCLWYMACFKTSKASAGCILTVTPMFKKQKNWFNS